VHAIEVATLIDTIDREQMESFGRIRSATKTAGTGNSPKPTVSTAHAKANAHHAGTTEDMEKLRWEVEKIFSPEQTVADESLVRFPGFREKKIRIQTL
jgi:hypothetical protein